MKIRSNVELTYDSRENESAIIQLEVVDWTYNAKNKVYLVTIHDSKVTMVEDEENEGVFEEFIELITVKSKYFTAEVLDAIFQQIGLPVTLESSYSEQMDVIIRNALLIIVQGNPLYGSVSENWAFLTP